METEGIEQQEVCSRCKELFHDAWDDGYYFCGDCRDELKENNRRASERKLTRFEQLQRAADAGVDTWEEWNGER